jgi:hypothetical protein
MLEFLEIFIAILHQGAVIATLGCRLCAGGAVISSPHVLDSRFVGKLMNVQEANKDEVTKCKEEVTILRVVFHCTEFHREDYILHTCNKQRRRLVDNTMLDNAMAYRS